jgi:dTDP-4-dehydrorhamnose 3,5-epimerase
MHVERKTINFEDVRGTIMDIIQDVPFEHATIIFTKQGGVRGNHYHKKSVQYVFIVSGKLRTVSKNVSSEKLEEVILEQHDLIMHEPMEAHAYEAVEDTLFLTLTKGPRGGTNYERDTFRLKKPLIVPK